MFKILVVEDDKELNKTVCSFLNHSGYEFAQNVRELNEDIPILFMTARDDIASKQRGFRIGVDDYMVKPIDLDELFLRIGALLRRAKIAANREFSILYKLLSYPKKHLQECSLWMSFGMRIRKPHREQ